MNVHDRRIEHEWEFLVRLADCNASLISSIRRKSTAEGSVFDFHLSGTSAFLGSPPALTLAQEHDVSLRFVSFFPAVPIEAFLRVPVFHPNVHPLNGFVCLWDRFSSGDSTLDAVVKLQRVLAWELHNPTPDHLMQPEALAWCEQLEIPLAYTRLQIPPDLVRECGLRKVLPQGRKRLSDLVQSNVADS